ncbi:MAG TPA: type IV toxin-antitoxin system AbiEi family antitoxin domain-containing protein [Chlamydiales bacterium]|jgi:predicted transcriptional regulator of viral defense system|nr:type IV toxin-antitoxin system AbiEi family antitoxin domain-containing protein [Chlamydiales bacterium]
MRPKSCLQALTPLLKKPSFTSREARALGVPSAVLGHYVKTGKLKKLSRGLYRDATYKSSALSLWSDLVETVSSIPSGVVCLISALALYNLTEELPRQHWIGIRHGTTAKSTRQIKIVRFRNLELGKTEIEVEGLFIPIFNRERTIVDAFRLLSRETAIKALKAAIAKGGKNRLDLIKLEAYAKKLRFDITPYLLSVTT